MVELFVDNQACDNFFSFFGPIAEKQIATFYNPDFIINFAPIAYSLAFLKDEIIIFTLKGRRVIDITRSDYNELIPDSFLSDLLNLEKIPSRVKRYRKIGKERLRKELADELRLGGITAQNTIAIWENYHLKIIISPELKMEIS